MFNCSNDINSCIYMPFGVAEKMKFDIRGADGIIGFGRGENLFNYSVLHNIKKSKINFSGFSIKFNNLSNSTILYYGDEHEDFINNNYGFCPLVTKTKKEKYYWSCKLNSFSMMFKEKMLIIPGFGMKCAKFFERFVSDKALLRMAYRIQKKKASK